MTKATALSKLELLAPKLAVTEKFKDYFRGATFTAFTVNNLLVHLNTATHGAVEQRRVAQLASFDFDIKYRPGVANKNVDVLSRFPQEEEVEGHQVAAEGSQVTQSSPSEWADKQQKDSALWVVS